MPRLVLFLFALLLSACSGNAPPTPDPTVIIPETTKVTDAGTRMALSAYDRASGEMRFSQRTPLLDQLKVNDVLVSEPTSAAPSGYLRKVTAISTQGGAVVLQTTQAKLTEAVSKGVLEAKADLTPDKLQATTILVKGVSITTAPVSGALRPQAGAGENYHFFLHLNHVFVPQAGENVSGSVTVDGTVEFNAGYGVHVGISGCLELPPVCIDSVEAKVGYDEYANLKISGEARGQLGDDLKLATQYYQPYTFFIGPVPVVIVPRIDLYLAASGQVEAKVDFQAGEASVAQLGARWTPADGWKNISGFDLNGDVPVPTFQGTLKPRAGARTTLGFKLYDVAGPEMSLQGGIELDGELHRSPLWRVNGYLKGNVDFKVELPILGTLAEYRVTLFDTSREFRSATNNPPSLQLTAKALPDPNVFPKGSPRTVYTRMPVDLKPGCPGTLGDPYYLADDPEEGCGVAVTLTSDKDGALSFTPTFSTPGVRAITVTVRDRPGLSVSKTFSLNAYNPAPTLTLANSGDPRQGEGYSVALTITDPNEADPGALCAKTTWSVDAPDTLATINGCLQTVTFAATGARQVRVSTTDSEGAVTSKTLTLNVQPPPANPYPRIASRGVYSRDLTGGEVKNCLDVAVLPGSTIDLSQDGCTLSVTGTPPKRFSAKVTVENPQNEALTYDWRLYATGLTEDMLLSSLGTTQTSFELTDPGNNALGTYPCRVTLTINAPDPARSKGPVTVWSGRCTLHYTVVH